MNSVIIDHNIKYNILLYCHVHVHSSQLITVLITLSCRIKTKCIFNMRVQLCICIYCMMFDVALIWIWTWIFSLTTGYFFFVDVRKYKNMEVIRNFLSYQCIKMSQLKGNLIQQKIHGHLITFYFIKKNARNTKEKQIISFS